MATDQEIVTRIKWAQKHTAEAHTQLFEAFTSVDKETTYRTMTLACQHLECARIAAHRARDDLYYAKHAP